MMGCGKTTVGRLLAARTGWPYIDNDELLARLSGANAKEVLERAGESSLRAAEADALRVGLQTPAPCIIGAAAGSILDTNLRAEFDRSSKVVWLTASPRILARRARGAAHRPWLDTDAVTWMSTTLAERAPLYELAADLIVITDRRKPSAIAAQIANWLEEH